MVSYLGHLTPPNTPSPSFVGLRKAEVADARRDTCSREVFRHEASKVY